MIRSKPSADTSEPIRTCVGCRQRAVTSELLRVVAGSGVEGQPALVPDPDRTAPGRGAHLHPTIACYDLALRRHSWPRALRARTQLAPELVREYLAQLTDPSNRPEDGARSS